MTDYTEQGAVPVDDAVSPDPPTIDEAIADRDARREQRRHTDGEDTNDEDAHDKGRDTGTEAGDPG